MHYVGGTLMMSRLFENTVSAICYEVAYAIDAAPSNEVTAFVLGQWGRMPRFLAWPLRLATLAFACAPILSAGTVFHRLPPLRRGRHLDAWRHSSIGPCRDLIRFYRSLSLLALYSQTGQASASAEHQLRSGNAIHAEGLAPESLVPESLVQ